MKREFPPVQLALILVLVCIIFRIIASHLTSVIPNFSPLMAVAFVGAMYLPFRWGWLMGPIALVVSDLAFLKLNYLSDGSGSLFSWMTILSVVIYAAAGALGIYIVRRKSLMKIVGGSLACSFVFYVATNTFSWWHDYMIGMPNGYAPTFAGWVQANTFGLPQYGIPSWVFLRNGMAGDLFFSLVLLFILDRTFLMSHFAAKATQRA